MGKRKLRIQKKCIRKTYLLGLFVFCIPSVLLSQVNGVIINQSDQPLDNISVILQKSQDSTIVAYTQTNDQSFYSLKAKQPGKHFLKFSSLSYAPKVIEIDILDINKPITIDVVLTEQQEELDEIIINADLPIRVKKDTIIFDAKAFMQGNEEVVEDLLRKIPGLQIGEEGTIKINNQEVEKVMVEGDDFFERGYKILTKNMPAKPLNKVEVYQHYSSNKLLKGIEESDKVAINLTLDEDAKRQWFGNVELGQDLELDSFYRARFNLMSFGKKNKFYFLGNANSTGEDATGDISSLINPARYGEPGRMGDSEQVNNLLNLEAGLYNFSARRSNFNNAELLSLNAIFNPTDKLKIKTLAFFDWDETDFFRNSTSSFFANGTNFTNKEDYILRNTYQTTYGKFQLNYDLSKKATIESVTSYSDRGNDAGSNLQFNDISTIEALTTAQERFDHITTYTQKIDDQKVLLATARVINEHSPQDYQVNQYFFDDLFNINPRPDHVQQALNNEMLYAGLNLHYLDRRKNGHLLELQVGNEYRQDQLENELRFRESGTNTSSQPPPDYGNDVNYSVNDLYIKSKYLYKIGELKITGTIDAHQLSNELETTIMNSDEAPFFVNPQLSLGYEINRKNKLGFGISHNTTNAGILDVYDNYVLTSYRSFARGTGDFNQLESGSVNLSYTLGNWTDQFLANVFATYTRNHDFFSTNSLIQQQFSQTDKILIEDRATYLINTNLDYYINKLTSNFKVKANYTQTEFKNIINDSDLRAVQTVNYGLGFELRSAFSGIFNYHIGTKWAFNTVEASGIKNSFTDNTSFLDLSFVINDQLDFQLKTERYFFGNINDGDNTYYFMDLDTRYKVKDSKFSFSLEASNLTNTEEFRTSSINDVSSSTVTYRLLPRYLLLNVKYRF